MSGLQLSRRRLVAFGGSDRSRRVDFVESPCETSQFDAVSASANGTSFLTCKTVSYSCATPRSTARPLHAFAQLRDGVEGLPL
jgi:hypothetical protein